MNQTKAFVIAITAVSGGGKTAVTERLEEALPNAWALYFDVYDFDGPESIPEWVERGADYDEWDLSPLFSDIGHLQHVGCDYIVLVFPFAYQHKEASDYIDLVIFIDTPLDIAFGRRIIRDYSDSNINRILSGVEHYMTRGRSGYVNMLRNIKPDADVIIDGTLSVTDIVSKIISYMEKIQKA